MSSLFGYKNHRAFRIIFAAVFLMIIASALVFADEIPSSSIFTDGFSNNTRVKDSSRTTWATAYASNGVAIKYDGGIDAVYVEFDRLPPGPWLIKDIDTGITVTGCEYGFLHAYADLRDLFGYVPKYIYITFAEGSVVADVHAYSGSVPDSVQKWQPCLDRADIVLLTTHSDDEQLFFAGIMPYYAVERKLDVQVVYFVQHYNGYDGQGDDHVRPHEQLDGLWTVGIRNYPYISNFPDCYAKNNNRETVLRQIQAAFANHGFTYDDFMNYVVGVIRRFKPQVLISHDLNGEYGHGAHALNADVCTKAVQISGDPTQFPDSVAAYGTWTPKKLYLHLYEGESIVMNWDIAYESLGGRTPFQTTQAGWMCHESQHYAWFYRWILGTSSSPIYCASQIDTYSPCRYGLYFRTVGPDIYKNDMFENLTGYKQQDSLLKAEAAAFTAGARSRVDELNSKLNEEAPVREEQRVKAEEARLLVIAEEESYKKKMITIGAVSGFALLVIIIVIISVSSKRRKRRRRKQS